MRTAPLYSGDHVINSIKPIGGAGYQGGDGLYHTDRPWSQFGVHAHLKAIRFLRMFSSSCRFESHGSLFLFPVELQVMHVLVFTVEM